MKLSMVIISLNIELTNSDPSKSIQVLFSSLIRGYSISITLPINSTI